MTKQQNAPGQPNPYEDLSSIGFWKTGVAAHSAFDIRGLWQPKFRVLPKHSIVTAGSCFAQHIGRALSARGYGWMDAETAPKHLSEDSKKKFNYGIFSFRTGNIYTPRALYQWLSWAFEVEEQPQEVWEKDGRFYDPFRPAIEPGGFASAEELMASRAVTLAAIRHAVETTNFFVFTLGLTESWYHVDHGHEYAMCPGTIAGEFDPEVHKFHNHFASEIKRDVLRCLKLMRSHNKRLQLLLTISPVPLTATASGNHVLTATTYSKSTLRSVAGELAATRRFIDYFPSYEIITSSPYRAMFFEPNLRSVSASGVALVMQNFFDDQAARFGPQAERPVRPVAALESMEPSQEDVRCEEEMLDAFSR